MNSPPNMVKLRCPNTQRLIPTFLQLTPGVTIAEENATTDLW